jgi:hypothetical protein
MEEKYKLYIEIKKEYSDKIEALNKLTYTSDELSDIINLKDRNKKDFIESCYHKIAEDVNCIYCGKSVYYYDDYSYKNNTDE